MRRKILPAITFLLVAFTFGALLGRRWRGDFADIVLTLVALLTILLTAWVVFGFLRARTSLRAPESGEDGGKVGPRKWVLRLKNVGRLEYIQIAVSPPKWGAPPPQWHTPRASWALVFFGLSLVVYAITRFVALDQFPIYFFADEAIEGVLASQLMANGWRDYLNHPLPVFFNTYGFFNPLIGVYAHAIGIALFGKSIVVTRGVSAFMSLLGSAAVALTLKFGFKLKYWWLGLLFLAATPIWFLHSRTAFETVMMVSAYAFCLLFYILYRYRSPLFVFPTLFMAALSFYSYGNGQLVVGVTGILLALSDWRYHLKNWRVLLVAAPFLLMLAVPYLQYRNDHPDEISYHLRTLDTYWFRAIPLQDKIGEFLSRYAYGVSPFYWFIPNAQDLARHRMKDYGNIALWTLPLFLIGVGVCFWRVKSSAHRLALVAALAAPIGGALTNIASTRVMAFVVPAAVFSALGAEFLIERLRRPVWQNAVAVGLFLGLSTYSLVMTGDALINGPLWYTDYGLYGMQWGAEQVFQTIPTLLKESPQTQVLLTPTWANGTDVFLDYFMPHEPRVRFQNVESFIAQKQPLDDNMLLMMTPEELRKARASNKFQRIQVERMIPYPDGSEGFYFVRLAYVDNVDALFAADQAARLQPVTDVISLDGENVTVTHLQFEAGRIQDLFDGDTFTLVRFIEANPVYFEMTFPSPHHIGGLALDTGTMDYTLTVSLYASENAGPIVYTQTYRNLPSDPHVELPFPNAPETVKKMRIEIQALGLGGQARVHVREIKFK